MEIEELVKLLSDSNLKQVHRDTGIPYDRMFKWTKGKGRPKSQDFETLRDYFKNGTNSNIETSDSNMDPRDREIELLRTLVTKTEAQLRDKDALLASKDEILTLLREKVSWQEKKISAGDTAVDSKIPVRPVDTGKRPGKLR